MNIRIYFVIISFMFLGAIPVLSQYVFCDEIEDIVCEFELLNGIEGTMSSEESGGPQPNPLCSSGGQPNNILWFAIRAPYGEYSINISFQNCESEDSLGGIQIGLYTDCTFAESVYCEPECINDDVSISSSKLVGGQTYYLFIDGCFNTICDYRIEAVGNFEDNFQISGQTFIDYNADGIQNGLEPDLENVNITLNPGGLMTLSNEEGFFSFEELPEESYTIMATISEGEWIEDEMTIEVTEFSSCEPIEIGFVPDPNSTPDALVGITNLITRCNQEANFFITIHNTSANTLDGTFEFTIDDLTSYVSSDIPNVSVDGSIISGNTGVLEPYEVKEFLVRLKMPAESDPLPELEYAITVFDDMQTPIAEYGYSEQLRCSYDPNDKKEHPDRPGDENLTLMEEDLEYKIRFQNNGNDTAFLVRIVDELDPSIDLSSLRVIDSSHPVVTSIDGSTLQFLFEDIMLVDSMTNFDDSQGFVSFRCNVIDGIPENTEVTNQADIIFDFNAPIVTNTTLNTFVSVLCTSDTTVINATVCEGDSYLGYDSTGVYTIVEPIEFGCDSTTIINLEVKTIGVEFLEFQVCEGDQLIINETEYIFTESIEIIDTTLDSEGCISLLTTIDVLVNTNLMITIDTSICEGESYLGYDSTGIYTIVEPLGTGCDSTTLIILEVKEIETENISLEVCEGDQLVINETEYIFTESIEIIDTTLDSEGCIRLLTSIDVLVNPTQMISIDTTICEGLTFFGFSESGQYSLDSINDNGCLDTYSILLTVLPLSDPLCTVGTEDLSNNEISIYPNPTRDQLFIEGGNRIEYISIYSMAYQKVEEIKVENGSNKIQISTDKLNQGLYLIAIKSGGRLIYKKLIVEK